MKYIAFPIEEFDTIMEISVGEVNRWKDIIEKEEEYHPMSHAMKAKWEGKVEALGEMLKFGEEFYI